MNLPILLLGLGLMQIVTSGTAETYEISSTEESYATEETGSSETEDIQATQERLLSTYDFGELNDLFRQNWQEDMNFEELVQGLMQGDVTGDGRDWKSYLYQIFLSELNENRGILIRLFLLAVVTAIFTNMGGTVGKGLISENGFYITYLMMTALLMSSFTLIYQVARPQVVSLPVIV